MRTRYFVSSLSLVLVLLLPFVFVVVPVPAQADAFQTNADRCNDNTFHPDLRIDACTWLLNSGWVNDETNVSAFYNRGNAYNDNGQYDRAIADFDEAIRLRPGHARALNGMAWLLATAPQDGIRNGVEAVGLAKRAIIYSKSSGYPDRFDTLAAAHAEAGDFAAAIDAQQRAIVMLRDAGRTEEIPEFQSRLDLYSEGRPYRLPL